MIKFLVNLLVVSPILWILTRIKSIVDPILLLLLFYSNSFTTNKNNINETKPSKYKIFFLKISGFFFGFSVLKWIVSIIVSLFSTKEKKVANLTECESSSSSSPPSLFSSSINYKKICRECENEFTSKKFPFAITIIEPPHLAINNNNNNKSMNSVSTLPKNNPLQQEQPKFYEFPKVLKYALSHPTSLTLQLFCSLYGIPFAVTQSDVNWFLTSSSSSPSSCPVFIKIDFVDGDAGNIKSTILLKGKDSSHLLEQLVKFLLPFGSQISSSSSSSDSMIIDSEEREHSSVANNNNNNSTCCKNRDCLVSLFHTPGDPLSSGCGQLKSTSDAQRNTMLRRIIDTSITPMIETALKEGIISSSSSSITKSEDENNNDKNRSVTRTSRNKPVNIENTNQNKKKSVSPLESNPNFLSFCSSNEHPFLRSVLCSLLTSSSLQNIGGTNSTSSTNALLPLLLMPTFKQNHNQADLLPVALLTSSKSNSTLLIATIRILSSFIMTIPRNFLSSAKTKYTESKFLLDETLNMWKASTNSISSSFNNNDEDLIQTRLREDLNFLERFIANTSANNTFLFDAETPTVADCAALSICVAAVHSENVFGLYDEVITSVSTCDDFVNDNKQSGSSSTSISRQSKLYAFSEFIRRRSVKKYMERCMNYFYPGSVLVSSMAAPIKCSANNNNNHNKPFTQQNEDDQKSRKTAALLLSPLPKHHARQKLEEVEAENLTHSDEQSGEFPSTSTSTSSNNNQKKVSILVDFFEKKNSNTPQKQNDSSDKTSNISATTENVISPSAPVTKKTKTILVKKKKLAANSTPTSASDVDQENFVHLVDEKKQTEKIPSNDDDNQSENLLVTSSPLSAQKNPNSLSPHDLSNSTVTTTTHCDLQKFVTGTHLTSPHDKEKSWLKRSGSKTMMKAAERKKWEKDLVDSFNNSQTEH